MYCPGHTNRLAVRATVFFTHLCRASNVLKKIPHKYKAHSSPFKTLVWEDSVELELQSMSPWDSMAAGVSLMKFKLQLKFLFEPLEAWTTTCTI